MSSVEKGIKVRVLPIGTKHHGFEGGSIVTSTGEDFGHHQLGVWANFEDEVGYTQFMLPQHYEVVSPVGEYSVKADVDNSPTPDVTFPILVEETGVVENLPGKVVYAVINADGEIYTTTGDRDYARTIKAALGGKRKGVKIFHYAPVKEIR